MIELTGETMDFLLHIGEDRALIRQFLEKIEAIRDWGDRNEIQTFVRAGAGGWYLRARLHDSAGGYFAEIPLTAWEAQASDILDRREAIQKRMSKAVFDARKSRMKATTRRSPAARVA